MKINIKFQHTKRQQQDEWHTGGHEHNMKKKKENPATMLLNSHWYNNPTRMFCPKFIFKAIFKRVRVFIWMPASDYY